MKLKISAEREKDILLTLQADMYADWDVIKDLMSDRATLLAALRARSVAPLVTDELVSAACADYDRNTVELDGVLGRGYSRLAPMRHALTAAFAHLGGERVEKPAGATEVMRDVLVKGMRIAEMGALMALLTKDSSELDLAYTAYKEAHYKAEAFLRTEPNEILAG